MMAASRGSLGRASDGPAWRRFVDTALPAEAASTVPGKEQLLEEQEVYRVKKNSVVVLIR